MPGSFPGIIPAHTTHKPMPVLRILAALLLCGGLAAQPATADQDAALARQDVAQLFALSERQRHAAWPQGYTPPPLHRLDEVQAALPELLGAFMSWTPLPDGQLLTIVATNHNATFFVQPLPPWTDELLEQFLLSLQQPPAPEELQDAFDQYTRQAIELYELLLADALAWLPPKTTRLVVSPFGKWRLLPLQALIAEVEHPVASYQYLPFLGKKYRFDYTLSGSAWLEARRRAARQDKPEVRALLVAPDYFGYEWPHPDDRTTRQYLQLLQAEEGALPSLTATPALTETIERLGGQVWRAGQATPKQMTTSVPSSGVWHAQAHLLPRGSHPDSLLLVLTPWEDDGLLPLGALATAGLHARLAVLPACHWGMLSLPEAARALQSLLVSMHRAGTATTLVNLWYANDEADTLLFGTFYSRLQAGLPPSEALAQAQIAWLNETKTNIEAHPSRWARYAIWGADASVPLRRSPLWWYVPMAVLVMGWFVWRYLRQLKQEAQQQAENID